MSLRPSVAQVLADHVTFELESIDRTYLNLYVPRLQTERQVASFCRYHLGKPFASSALLQPKSEALVTAIRKFGSDHKIPMVDFRKGQRKDDIAAEHLGRFTQPEGVLFIGRAQEKTAVFRTERRRHPETGAPYPWIVRSTAMVNHFYFYAVDEDFGPFFVKFGTYFPYPAKVCLNGHEWLKRQATKHGIGFEPLDNGVAGCDEPDRLQQIADSLDATAIQAFVTKWLGILPQPFTPEDNAAGYSYHVSILQSEFSLTQVFDRPVAGRQFFEEVIRENLDLGRPDQVALIFNRRVIKTTPGRFRTRVITQGVVPTLHVDYKHSRIKQYFKLGRALRTETTINDTRDFAIGKRLCNLPLLREVGFKANRRLLSVQRLSHDCALDEDSFLELNQPVEVDGQRGSALRFAHPTVQALLACLLVFRLNLDGFTNRDLKERFAPLLGLDPSQISRGRMTYELRRLRLHGLIERIPRTHRYRATDQGLRTAMLLTRAYDRLLRPGLTATLSTHQFPCDLRLHFDRTQKAIDHYIKEARLVA
ncbi:MAG: hypothetical protein ACRD1R_12840 [Acidobacteriota bacterium]